MRYEVGAKLTPREAEVVEAALAAYLESFTVRPAPWALAGRAEGASIGALQIRHQSVKPWREVRLNPYTRRGTTLLRGRGDAR